MAQLTARVSAPRPLSDELPSAYAYRVGQWYLTWNIPDKSLGQVFTPLPVAQFMSELLPARDGLTRILDPSAGLGILACAVCEVLQGDIELEAYEVDSNLIDYLAICLDYAGQWMRGSNRNFTYRIVNDDFVIAYSDALRQPVAMPFHMVICNPPYFKLAKSDRRTQAVAQIVYGQPNIYALFMALSAALLHPEGYAVFITPRSYTAGQYFSRFREYFFSIMRPRALHLFESRRDVFDDVLQESLIMLAQRSTRAEPIVLSSSANYDFSNRRWRTKSTDEVMGDDSILHLPLSEEDDAIAALVRSWTGRLRDYNMEISTGPVVPFRAAQLISSIGDVPSTHAPLLWMQNVKPMRCEWPVHHKAQYIALRGADRLLLPNRNYVLLRRFSSKEEHQRITAAAYLADIHSPTIGLENHLNYIYRPNGELSDNETVGLATLLNSRVMDAYFRLFSGNTQVNATELRNLPLPPLDAIIELGRSVTSSTANVDRLITEVLGIYA